MHMNRQYSNFQGIWCFRLVVQELGCSDDEHVLGDQQAEQDAPYFIQLWTHSCFSGSAGSHTAALPCFAFLQFTFFFLLVLAVPSYTHSSMT